MSLLGGVIDAKYDGYNLVEQWTSYGWNVFTVENGNDYGQVVAALKTMEEWDPSRPASHDRDRQDHQGLLAGAVDGKIPGARRPDDRVYQSHPYAMKMNSRIFRRAGARRLRSTTASSSRAFARARSPTRASG